MNRSYQLQFCKVCRNKSFSSEKGIVCGLTNEHADFTTSCKHFSEIESTDHSLTADKKIGVSNIPINKLKSNYSGYLIALYSGFVLLIPAVLLLRTEFSIGIFILSGLISLISSIISLVILYNIWDFIIEEYRVQRLKPPVKTPGEAIGFLFIPLFNFYWMFIAIGKMPACLNELGRTRGSKLLLSENLGVWISILTLFSIIPFAGIIGALINAYILLPILLSKSIQALTLIPPYAESIRKGKVSIKEKIDAGSVRDFRLLFKTEQQGFNLKLGIAYLLAIFLYKTFLNTVFNDFNISVFFNAYFFGDILLEGIFIYLIIILAGVLNDALLALFTGIINFVKVIGGYGLIYLLYRSKELDIFSQILKISTTVVYLVYGLLLIISLKIVIRLWGIKFWGILIATISTSLISNLVWIGLNFIFKEQQYDFNFELLYLPFFYGSFLALAFYIGFIWHSSTINREEKTGQNEEMLDYDL
jgi:hypothetical protein